MENGEIKWHLENFHLQQICVMVHCLICTLNVTADLYGFGSIKRKTGMKNSEPESCSICPLLSVGEMKREEGKKWQQDDGQGTAMAVLLSFPVLTEALLPLDHKQATSKLHARASETKRPMCK